MKQIRGDDKDSVSYNCVPVKNEWLEISEYYIKKLYNLNTLD